MKKNIKFIIFLVALTLILSALFVACAESQEYSATVLSPDGNPLENVTVNWLNGNNVAGSAKTDANGKATVTIPAGKYTISLEGIAENLSFDEITVFATSDAPEIRLSVKQVNFLIVVNDKTGAPAQNVTVNLANATGVAGSAKTDATGSVIITLPYGDYSVTLADLPGGNIYTDIQTVSGKIDTAVINLVDGTPVDYGVTLQSEGGLLFKNQDVLVHNSANVLVASGKTDENGVYAFSAAPGNYKVSAANIPDGYSFEAVSLTSSQRTATIVLHSAILYSAPAANKVYKIGDIFHNYRFTTTYKKKGESNVWSKTIAEILEDEGKEAIIINNWGTNCSACVQEMPYMQTAYEKYKDKIEMIAVSNYIPADTVTTIENWYATYKYTFPMMLDSNGFRAKFNITNWPTTVIIDRYGAIARIEVGAVVSDLAWERLIEMYIGDDYVQTFTPGDEVSGSINLELTKPDVTTPENHYENLANAINNTSTFPDGASITWRAMTGEGSDKAWPFFFGHESTERFKLPTLKDGEYVMYSTNTGRASSMSAIYADVSVSAGYVFTFDYLAETKSGDILYFVWDGKVINQITGTSDGWKTCYLYADLTAEEHSLAITYMKYNSGSDLLYDNVFITNVRFEPVSVLSDDGEELNMLRSAAYGVPEQGAEKFPHYATVDIDENGYYYVNLSSLENAEFAGNDNHPMLFANLLNVTTWANDVSISQLITAVTEEGSTEYAFDCIMIKNGKEYDYRADLINYCYAASASDIDGFVPVNQQLREMLEAFMKSVSGANHHEDEWLEVCYFYSHYGAGEPIGNPILGVITSTAIPVELNQRTTAELYRNMAPFPSVIYEFTPDENAVYKIESLIDKKDASKYSAMLWLYDDEHNPDEPLAESGEERVTLGGVNEQNFEVYRYLKANRKYYVEVALAMQERGEYDFIITKVGQSATVLSPCSMDTYNMILDENGEWSGAVTLAGAIEYKKDADGFYHAINPDGTVGDFIYLSTKYADTSALSNIPLKDLVDKFVVDINEFEDNGKYKELDYTIFNFRYVIDYIIVSASDVRYYSKFDLVSQLGLDPEIYKDYTARLKEIIATADENGFVKVDQEIVDILTLFVTLRLNTTINGVIDHADANEWLRFCWYNRPVDENNN